MSNEALLRLILSSAILGVAHILVQRYLYPIYKRIEDRSRAKAEAEIEAICARIHR
jgi:hypothetical protein